MLGRAVNFVKDLRDRQRIGIALSRGAAGKAARRIDLSEPETWEFSGFSQNGEDGVLDVLRGQLAQRNRYFLEIGAADGLQNNSAWLLVADRHYGLMIEGDPALSERARRMVEPFGLGSQCRNMFVTLDQVPAIAAMLDHRDPDVVSIDIDGNDLHIARALLDAGVRPKILVVEYNSVFGPDRSATVPYRADFDFRAAHPTQLYYGVSIAAWRALLGSRGYRFVTVESCGVNAFFVDPSMFDDRFLVGVRGREFEENRYQRVKFGARWEQQYALIANQALEPV
jgi:hypothetical protein